MDVGGLLKAARYGAGLSQRALAARSGVASSSLCRFESGAATPSLQMVERLLATCGKDATWTLVERHADLDAELDRQAALPPLDRLFSLGLLAPYVLPELAGLDVLVGGAWAASLHGIPHDGDHGVVWCSADDDAVAALAALLQRRIALFSYEGQWSSPNIRPSHLRGQHPEWLLRDVGRFATRLVPSGEPWPREVRVVTSVAHSDPERRVLLRVVPAEDLGPEDGVRPEVLERYLARRAAAGDPR